MRVLGGVGAPRSRNDGPGRPDPGIESFEALGLATYVQELAERLAVPGAVSAYYCDRAAELIPQRLPARVTAEEFEQLKRDVRNELDPEHEDEVFARFLSDYRLEDGCLDRGVGGA